MSLANFGVNRHVATLGVCFRIAGVALGLPAFAFTCFDGWNAYQMFEAPPGDSPSTYDSQGGLITIITAMAEGAESGLHILAGAAAWLFTALAIFGAILTFFGLFFYLTGGAIARRTGWGRGIGSLLSLLALAASTATIALVIRNSDLNPTLAYIACVPFGASLYALWVLTLRYS